jgi:multiple sugar transport system permease protein
MQDKSQFFTTTRDRRAFPRLPKFADVLAYSIVILMVIFATIPLYWTFITAFKTLDEFQTYPPTFWPSSFTFINFEAALNSYGIGGSIKDSVIVSLGIFALSMVVGVPAAYSLARYKTGGDSLAFNILSFRFMPPIVPLVAFYLIGTQLRLLDTYVYLIFVGSLPIIPFVVWIMKGFIEEIPPEIEESSQIDGASWLQMMQKILIPIAMPGLVTTSLFSIVFAWNELLFSVALTGRNIEPITKQIPGILIGTNEPHWGALAATAMIMIIPVLLLAFFLQKYIVRGLTYGAVK